MSTEPPVLPERPAARYILSQRDGVDTLHRDPLEVCNVDDAADASNIDEFSAEAMLLRGDARACKHCLKGGWG